MDNLNVGIYARSVNYWEITDYHRISAHDGRDDDLSGILKGRYPEQMTSGEVGCVTSHLKAIKHWYETSDSPYAIIMEDDCSLDIVRYWNFTWNDAISKVPYDWDVIQLAIICTGDVCQDSQEICKRIFYRMLCDYSSPC